MTRARPRDARGAAAALAVLLALASRARAQHPSADSLRVAGASRAETGAIDRVARDHFLLRHAVSLDQFLEFQPGGFLVRLGPIGNDARYSRWGIGRGRARLRLNGIPFNDPQDDSAPWVHAATSGLGTLTPAHEDGVPWIEGTFDLDEMRPPVGRPHTFLELSNGSHSLRQRRVRFASEESAVGVDLAYDEVLDDGYPFDASGTVPDITDYGSAQSRHSTLVLRGDPEQAARFGFGVRNFTSSTQGDLESNTSEGRESGHLAWLDAGVARAHVALYARGFSSSAPDSAAENETVGAMVSWSRAGADALTVRAHVEGTHAAQEAGGAASHDDLVRAWAGVDGSRSAGARARLTAGVTVAGDEETPFEWGARLGARWEASRHALAVAAARSFRLPNFGERYLPAHVTGANTLAGDAEVGPETAWEVTGDWDFTLSAGGAIVNRVRASWVRAQEAIAFRPRAVGTEVWRVAQNADDARSMLFLEERARGEWETATVRVIADAAVLYTTGDRGDAFVAVPELQTNAWLFLGRSFFEDTSAIFLGVQFLSVDSRSDYDGISLPSFQVLNVMLEGRLLDARLYLGYLNIMDEVYRTQGDYLMTPRSLVYGIEWTLFD